MNTWITIETDPNLSPEIYPVDTVEEIAVAVVALKDAGHDQAPVYVGDPDSPDCYRNGQIVFAAVVEACQSIGIRKVAHAQGGEPTLSASVNVRGENYRLWDLPNGSRAIETNGDPVFEDADSVEFEELRSEVFGA